MRIRQCAVGEQHTVCLNEEGEAFLFGFGKDFPSRLVPQLTRENNRLRAEQRVRIDSLVAAGNRTVAMLSNGNVVCVNGCSKRVFLSGNGRATIGGRVLGAATDGTRVVLRSQQNRLYLWQVPSKTNATADRNEIQPLQDLQRVSEVALSKEHIACVVAGAPRELKGSDAAYRSQLKTLMLRDDLADCWLRFVDVADGKLSERKIAAHRFVLVSRSPRLRQYFLDNPGTKEVCCCRLLPPVLLFAHASSFSSCQVHLWREAVAFF
jgi:hypothetical protein